MLAQTMTIGMAFLYVVALVVSQYFVKRRRVALGLTLVIWTVVLGIGNPHAVFFHFGASALMLVILLRWGIVALVVANTVLALGWLARCTDLSAWYAQPAITALSAVAALTVYGVWASSGGRPTSRAEG